MANSQIPNLNFGKPIIFFDSNPEMQESFIGSYWTTLKETLKTSWTGEVRKFHNPGTLRIIFWTAEGKECIKDYELHEYKVVREAWESLFNLPDVKRAIVMGYSGQNPYIKDFGEKNPWEDKIERERRRKKESVQRQGESKEGRTGKVIDIKSVIDRTEEEEVKKIAEASGKVAVKFEEV
ncbi:hypothetical protein MFRU_025g00360 [Monilinia fructicola]|uniref:Uncharacterized protein n=1 Tax=Monilinia fructicola TaxID=38448 RepID=A0A5M9JX43_MONFR|nr:hypothetical protein EYC84_003713 [Monilinia fructicola]KAG4027969.1 hypothetical protein MFRU_025g00360 [Monilinia fructicola]